MDDLLTPMSQVYKSASQTPLISEKIEKTDALKTERSRARLVSFDDALEALRNEPDYETLASVLKLLLGGERDRKEDSSATIHQPSPKNAQIIQVLVTDITPNYWRLLKDEALSPKGQKQRKASLLLHQLLECLRSVAGINAVLAHLRGLTGQLKASPAEAKGSHMALNLEICLELLCSLLEGSETVHEIWTHTITGLKNPSMSRPLQKELVNTIGGGKVVSLTAEAEQMTTAKETESKASFWVSSSSEYTAWLASNIVSWAQLGLSEEEAKIACDLLVRALRFGHSGAVIKRLVSSLLIGDSKRDHDAFETLFRGLPQMDQKRVLYEILSFASDTYFSGLNQESASSDDLQAAVATVASLVDTIVGQHETRRNLLIAWLTSLSGAGAGEPVGIRRAVVAVLAQHSDDIFTVLEKSLSQFGDQLYVRHSPILQQEAHAQVLLLSAGYVHRTQPTKLARLFRSSVYLNSVSNRLGAPQTRARILGLIVGEALSGLAQDTGKKKLDFHMEESKSEEAQWYKDLVMVSDVVGSSESLPKPEQVEEETTKKEKKTKASAKPKAPRKIPRALRPEPPVTARPIIQEVHDSDLVPDMLPGEDPEDTDSEVEFDRDKPRAPIYIRELISYFRDSDNYEKQHLALATAPTLIRRKANFGVEVKEHSERLAGLILGAGDKFKIDNFYGLRLQGMIALIVAQPQKMGPWFAKTFYEGDYSLSQRAAVLSTLGLAAREIAGLENGSEYADATAMFPSKLLPEKVENLFLEESSSTRRLGGAGGLPPSDSSLKPLLPSDAIDGIAKSITTSFLAPMAADAADAATGPDALKLSSFAQRQQQQQLKTAKKKPRVRAIPNTTAQVIATSFFFPLTARFQTAVRSSSSSSPYAGGRAAVVQSPELLAHLLRTLALLVHAAGPSTLALPDMTAELWRLVLGGGGIRARFANDGDLAVTRAALFALLALLDINGGDEARMREVCRELPREVVETQEWVSLVFERTRGGDGEKGEENEVKMLAAGVLIRLKDAMEKFRAFLLGDLIG